MNTLPLYPSVHLFQYIEFPPSPGWYLLSGATRNRGRLPAPMFPSQPIERPEFTLVPSPAVRELADYLG